MHVVTHQSFAELQRLMKKERDARRRDRLRLVVEAMAGASAPQIAASQHVARRTVQAWVQRYNAQGLEGLIDQRGGNHRHLSAESEQAIIEHLTKTARDPHQGVRRAEDLRQWIQQQFHVLYSLTGVYALLHRHGFSHLMPRPRHGKADPAAQEAFKKKRWSRLNRSSASIPINASKFGSRMKPASVSRGP